MEDVILFFDQKLVKSICGFLFRLVGNKDEAEDLTQETFMKAWANLHRFDRTKNFKTWLLSIARNSATDFLRKKKALPFSRLDHMIDEELIPFDSTIPSDDPTPLELAESQELQGIVDGALLKLSDNEQVLLLLRHKDELTFKEISYVFNKPLNTVKSQYRRALQRLYDLLLADPAGRSLALG
ncbi:MAG: sigW [Parcubacteria group bacterium]|nr:sigW [Parcubacteria group bacterium]